MIKRACDVVFALVGLVLAAPLFVVLAGLIKLDSRGPVFFRQTRIGKDGKPFGILKFRTMVENAYALGSRLTRKHDPRITRVGVVLRWLKLDEIPQLVNVLKGDMSFVGPRPEDPHFVAAYTPEQRAVLSVRPGIVGPSQILGRDELERYPEDVVDSERYYVEHILPEKLATDLAYVRSYGLLNDFRLILQGLSVTVFGAFKGSFVHFNRRRLALLAFDTLASLLVYHVAYGLKLEWSYRPGVFPYLAVVSALILLVRPPLFVYVGLYQNLLRYLGTTEFLMIAKAVTVGSVVIAAATFMLGFQGHSRWVLLLDWGLLILVLFASRVALRAALAYRRRVPDDQAKRVLIVGFDDMAGQLVHTMISGAGAPYRPVGFLDDDPAMRGATVHGVRVLGRVADLELTTALQRVDLVAILLQRLSPPSLLQVVNFCRSRSIPYRMLPTLDRLLGGDVLVPEPGDLGLDELLRGGWHGNGSNNGSDNGSETHRAAVDDTESRSAPRVAPVAERCVLVTGGAGYVGSHVIRKLLAAGHRVRVLDNYLYTDRGIRDLSDHPRLELIDGDIRHLHTMALAVKGVDSVIALAALVGDAACDLDEEETISTNLEATNLLVKVCQRAGVRRVVFASTCSVYGANSDLTLNEGSWLNPVSLYARTRIRSEEILLRRGSELSVTILRLATVFGLSPRMRFDLLVNTFTAHALLQRRIRVFGGRQWRPNLHVQDAADAFILASEAPDEKVRGEVFNVGDNALNHTVLDIARIVQRELPDTQIQITEGSPDQRDYRVSFDKILHVLGFRTQRTVRDGVRETVSALRARSIAAPDEDCVHNFRHLKTHGFRGTVGVSAHVP